MKGFEPSLFDKLFDDSPVLHVRRRLSLEDLKDSVARDLEALLNTRTVIDEDLAERFPLAVHSIASFGLNDFAGLSLASVSSDVSGRRNSSCATTTASPFLCGMLTGAISAAKRPALRAAAAFCCERTAKAS